MLGTPRKAGIAVGPGYSYLQKEKKSLSSWSLPTVHTSGWLLIGATVPSPPPANPVTMVSVWDIFDISVWYFVWLGKWCYQHVRWVCLYNTENSVIIFIPVWEVGMSDGRGSEVNVSEPKLECVGQIWMCWSDSLSCKPQDQDTQLKWARKRHCISLEGWKRL